MDSLDLFLGAKVDWVSDNLTPATIRPRHIGQPVTFFYYDSTSDDKNYDGVDVIGTLEGSTGHGVIVSGDIYDIDRVGTMKIWRRKIA